MATHNFLCISSFFKGADFLTSCKAEGNNVYLVTSKKLENEPWPWESIDEVFYIDDHETGQGNWNMEHVIAGLAHVMQSRKMHKIVALDDFDVEKAAHLREEFRVAGMGQTTVRYFRDKLAMRMKAQEHGIAVPTFGTLFNDDDINQYADAVEAPWLVKPRAEASAMGIKKAHSKEELWHIVHQLGDQRHQFLVEQFRPGDVYHVDSLSMNGEVIFARASQYLDTPMEVAHGGGVFRSQTLELGTEEEQELIRLNAEVLKAFGLRHSASHTEFIKSRETGQFVFLETSYRVGGAHLAEMVAFASGVNLWAEWARIETAVLEERDYVLPELKNYYAGIVVSLSRFKDPDTSSFNDPEIAWRLKKDYHIGFILRSGDQARVAQLLEAYTNRIARDFHASAPAQEHH